MASELKLRRGTTAEHATFTGAIGEVTVDTTSKSIVVHDGATAGGFPHLKADDLSASSGASMVGATPTGNLAGPTVQAQISELDTEKLAKAFNLSDVASIPATLANLGIVDYATETAISSATVLTSANFGTPIVLQAPTANYTVTLPTPVGNTGQILILRVALSAMKLVTLETPAGTIDGQTTRVLWRSESAVLRSDGTDWNKISGRTIPFSGYLERTASDALTAGIYSALSCNLGGGDPSGLNLAFDAGSSRFAAPRTSAYTLAFTASITGTSLVNPGLFIGVNSSTPTGEPSIHHAHVGTFSGPVRMNCAGTIFLGAGSYVNPLGWVATGTSPTWEYVAGVVVPTLTYAETPTW